MEKKINYLSLCYTLFLILLFLSGSLTGILSEAVYYLAFILPIGISIFSTRHEGESVKKYLTIDAQGIQLFAPLIFPTISLTIIISYVTSLIIFVLTGKSGYFDLGDSYFLALVTHALVPAIFEEALFRYVPMRLLAPHSHRCAIIVSAVFFSLVHGDLFKIPYAFLGGVIFMAIDIATDSIIPSVIIHFINNALSVSFYFARFEATVVLLYIFIGIFTLQSIALIWKSRHEYEVPLMLISEKGEGIKCTFPMIVFVLITLAISVLNLL